MSFHVLAEVKRHNRQAAEREALRDHGGSPESLANSPLAAHTPMDTMALTPGMRAAIRATRNW